MKKINICLTLLNLIILIFIVIKIINQEQLTEYVLDSDISEENIKYKVARELMNGEKGDYSEFNDEGKRINTSEELKKTLTLDDGLEVMEFNISYYNGHSIISAKIKNNTSDIKGGYNANLVFFNDVSEEIIKLKSYINKIQPDEESIISTSVDWDISNAYRCEIQKVEEKNNE